MFYVLISMLKFFSLYIWLWLCWQSCKQLLFLHVEGEEAWNVHKHLMCVSFLYMLMDKLEPLFMTKMSKKGRMLLISIFTVNCMVGLRLVSRGRDWLYQSGPVECVFFTWGWRDNLICEMLSQVEIRMMDSISSQTIMSYLCNWYRPDNISEF
jgi:hypothetical protein